MTFMKRFENETYALLRIFTGFLFLWHGSQKILGYPPSDFDPPFHIHWIAGGIELVGGILVTIGLFTAPVAFICSGLMAAAYWMAHGPTPFLPILNGGELAVMFCFAFLYISAKGSGTWSIDAARK